jgi:crossover junction endodeoxyribonuclease RuvC|tara:strand:- start:835 stop:1392 length:558 start_codon:yes stop_codon:yes gene_type:complete
LKSKTDRIILGIDPGTTIMGYGIIHIKGNKMEMMTMGVIHLSKLNEHADKLKRIFERTLKLIDEYQADEMALEAPFFGKNVQSMLKLGRAQGVAMAAGLYRNIPIFEYAPKKIKMSITGKGTSSKEQVAAMLKSLLRINEMPKHLDASDGLAAAVCHYFQNKKNLHNKSYSGWSSFLKDNPDRLS